MEPRPAPTSRPRTRSHCVVVEERGEQTAQLPATALAQALGQVLLDAFDAFDAFDGGDAGGNARLPLLGQPPPAASGFVWCGRLIAVFDEIAKDYLHDELRSIRSVLVRKVDGLSEYDVRRPLTATGTNLLGLIKHTALWESRYFGEVFGRPFPGPLPRWDDIEANRASLWVTGDEARGDIVDLYQHVGTHSDATIDALSIDATGHVPWWPSPDVMLFNVMVHMLTETTRHAGHADILREQLDGGVGDDSSAPTKDDAYWQSLRARIEDAARAADSRA